MPTISAFAQNLVKDARLSLQDVDTLKAALEDGRASITDVELLASRYANAFEASVGTSIQALLQERGRTAQVQGPRANLASAPGLLSGVVTLSETNNRKHASVAVFQQGLMALASRTGKPDYMLPKYGADGDYGSETVAAVKKFRLEHGLVPAGQEPSGTVDMHVAQKLDQLLQQTRIPPIFAGQTDVSTGALMAKAALDLVNLKPDAYGVPDPWVNHDPRHAITAWYGARLGAPINGLKDKWKCNLFACGVMVAAGFEPPYYRAAGKPTNQGEYPNANQLYKWSDKHAGSFGNRDFVRFELRGELDVAGISDPAEKEARIKELLSKVEPGDMVIVDHLGSDVADGGHCRVATGVHADGTVDFAQASHAAAEVQREDHRDLMNEETIWILRANKKRPEGPARVV